MADSEAMVLFALIFSLVASSFCVAWIANDYAESPPCLSGTSCAPIQLSWEPMKTLGELTTDDYTNTSGYNDTMIDAQEQWGVDYGEWAQGPGGFALTSSSTDLQSGEPYLYMKNVIPQNGVYTVDYKIDNVPDEWFTLYARHSTRIPDIYDIAVKFDEDGIHVLDYDSFGVTVTDHYFMPYPDSQTTIPGGSWFRLEYNTNINSLGVYKDDVNLFFVSGLHDQGTTVTGELQFAGVSSNSVGFSVLGSRAVRSLTPDTANNGDYSLGSIWSGIIGMVDGIIPGAGAVIQMMTLIGTVILYTLPESIFPLWLNMLLIKTQAVAIIYIGARLARGGG
jgi:hypothetical protein